MTPYSSYTRLDQQSFYNFFFGYFFYYCKRNKCVSKYNCHDRQIRSRTRKHSSMNIKIDTNKHIDKYTSHTHKKRQRRKKINMNKNTPSRTRNPHTNKHTAERTHSRTHTWCLDPVIFSSKNVAMTKSLLFV